MRIDAHQHFWNYSAAEYPWIGAGLERLARDYLPSDLEPLLAAKQIDGSVAVQARQSVEESLWLLALAKAHPLVKGVVGWVDLRSDRVGDDLRVLAANPTFVGVRHVVQDEPDPRFVLGEGFIRGLRQLRQHGLTYDLLLYPSQLPAAIELVELLPEQPFVVDHLAKPRIVAGEIDGWGRDIRAIARHDNVCCKVSGMVTEAVRRGWKRDDFTPYLDVVLEAFGPERLMFGSDWPVCLLAGEYADVAAIPRDYFSRLSTTEQRMIWGDTAAGFYGLK
ncbi:MAG: amidohydrolase [Planctomycetota bacterium]|jgi:L-fuconolactonase|nr:MAG: amidohydrolase [Planctomycetota bacterium]